MAVAHLLDRHLRHRRTRAVLTIAAIAVAISLVTALTSAFASLRGAAFNILGTMYGSTDVVIQPDEQRGQLIPATLADQLRHDSRVRRLTARLSTDSPLLDADDKPLHDRPASIIGLTPDAVAGSSVSALVAGKWFTSDEGDVAVVERHIAEKLNLKVGSTVSLPSPTGPLRLKVVGILGKPQLLSFAAPAVYMPLKTLRKWLNEPDRFSELDLNLQSGVDADAFAEHVKQLAAPLTLHTETAASRQRNFDKNFQALTILSYLGGTLSMLAAVFIVFSALTMGVSERMRSLGMLRAIGATRRQIALLVVGEGAALAVIGAIIGVPLGIGWAALMWWAWPHLFAAGLIISTGGAIYGALGTLAAALLAAALPAWAASRCDILEALTVTSRPHRSRTTVLCAIGGALLLAVDPVIAFTPQIPREFRMYAHFFVGLPALLLGLVGVAPLLVIAVDRAMASAVARLTRLEPALLRQQLTGGLWRTTGAAAGLMVGLLALVTIQTHGKSLATGWSLPTKFPDMLLVAPMGLDDQQIDKLQGLDEFAPPGVLPMAIVTPQFGSNLFGLGGFVKMPEGTILFGIDTDRAFGSPDSTTPPMIQLDFVEGDAASAARMLKQGRHVIVSDHFRRVKGLGVGDTITFDTPQHGKVKYTIAGVVRSVGVDMIVRLFEMKREFDRWTAAGAITTLADVRKDFGTQRIYLMTANVRAGIAKETVEQTLRDKLGTWGILAADARHVKEGIDKALSRLLDLISTIALAAIGVAALGVTNTIIASVRSRRWQMGVLRSLGLTRGALLRLVIAEALLIGLAAALLGIGGGLLLSVDANHLVADILGDSVPLKMPWSTLAFGLGLTLAVSALAALRPALTAARSDTLDLLKAGRAAE